jgi:hypothetical protein
MISYDENLDWLVPNDMQLTDPDQRTEMGRAIREIYTGGQPLAEHVGAGVRVSPQSSTGTLSPVFVVLQRHRLQPICNQTRRVLLQFSRDVLLSILPRWRVGEIQCSFRWCRPRWSWCRSQLCVVWGFGMRLQRLPGS